MMTECAVCYETKLLLPCGASTNCNVSVCDLCKNKAMIGDFDFVSKKCIFCYSYDYRDGLYCEFEDLLLYGDEGCEKGAFPYVILDKFMMKYKRYIEDDDDDDEFYFYKNLDYCWTCDPFDE